MLKWISKTEWWVWWSATLEPQNPALGFHLCLAELWSRRQLLFAANLNEAEADHGLRNSFYALNSYTVHWPWFPQEQIWEGCSQQDGPTQGGYKWDPKWEFHLLLLWSHMDLTNVSHQAPLRLEWHQLPGCGHHSSHTSSPLNSENNSLDRAAGLKSKGCPVPQRQWWDVMG